MPGGVLALSTGSQIKLTGVLMPQPPLNPGWKAVATRARLALKELRTLISGQKIRFALKAPRDRHGRPLVNVFFGRKTWLQSDMVARGVARVDPEMPGSECVTQLLKREAAARAAGAGFWADRDYQVQPAWATRRLRRLEHTFQIVSGRVLKVADTKRFTYLNFGKDWRTDFTASIKSRTARHLAEAGLKLSELEGRNIRVRGWITYRNGPMIEITQSGQIEVTGKQKGPGN